MATTALATLFDWWWPAMFGSSAPERRPPGLRQRHSNPCLRRSPPARSASSIATSSPATCSGCRTAPASAVSACSTSRAPRSATRPTIWPRCCRTLAATSRRTWREHAIAHYLAARPELDPAAFRAAYAACAAQRHLRIAGQWVRLARRDDRPGYLRHGPRTWRLLQQAVREPAAAPLAAALDRWIPPDRRGNPPDLAA